MKKEPGSENKIRETLGSNPRGWKKNRNICPKVKRSVTKGLSEKINQREGEAEKWSQKSPARAEGKN